MKANIDGFRWDPAGYWGLKNSDEVGAACVEAAQRVAENVRTITQPSDWWGLKVIQARGDKAGEITQHGHKSGAHAMVSVPFRAMPKASHFKTSETAERVNRRMDDVLMRALEMARTT